MPGCLRIRSCMPQKHPPARIARWCMSGLLDLIEIFAISFALHLVARNEAKRRGVNAVAQTSAIGGTVREYMTEMTVGVHRSDFRPHHTVRAVAQLVHICCNDGLGEAGPARTRVEFVGRGEQRLSRHDIDVDAWFLVVIILPREGPLGARLLGDVALLGSKEINSFLRLFELHDSLRY